MTAKENFLALVNGGKPDALVNEWEPFGSVFDPLMAMTLVAVPGQYVVDPWGVTYYWGEDEPGVMPIVNDETKVCKDITHWQDYVKAPDIMGAALDWSEESIRREVRRTCDTYAPGGSFIPCLTYGAAGSIFQNVDEIVMDEIRRLSPKYFI